MVELDKEDIFVAPLAGSTVIILYLFREVSGVSPWKLLRECERVVVVAVVIFTEQPELYSAYLLFRTLQGAEHWDCKQKSELSAIPILPQDRAATVVARDGSVALAPSGKERCTQ